MLGTMKRTNWWIAIGVLLIPLAYVGSYAALVERYTVTVSDMAPTFSPENVYDPTEQTVTWYSYRYGGVLAEILFMPINRIDQRLRSQPQN